MFSTAVGKWLSHGHRWHKSIENSVRFGRWDASTGRRVRVLPIGLLYAQPEHSASIPSNHNSLERINRDAEWGQMIEAEDDSKVWPRCRGRTLGHHASSLASQFAVILSTSRVMKSWMSMVLPSWRIRSLFFSQNTTSYPWRTCQRCRRHLSRMESESMLMHWSADTHYSHQQTQAVDSSRAQCSVTNVMLLMTDEEFVTCCCCC